MGVLTNPMIQCQLGLFKMQARNVWLVLTRFGPTVIGNFPMGMMDWKSIPSDLLHQVSGFVFFSKTFKTNPDKPYKWVSTRRHPFCLELSLAPGIACPQPPHLDDFRGLLRRLGEALFSHFRASLFRMALSRTQLVRRAFPSIPRAFCYPWMRPQQASLTFRDSAPANVQTVQHIPGRLAIGVVVRCAKEDRLP